jgi:hypothetical protein
MSRSPFAIRCLRWLAPVVALITSGMANGVTAGATVATTAGDFWVEPPTLRSLGFEWRIAGDDNRNASVAVS